MFMRRLYHPEMLQWNRKHKQYFEGWYFKSVSADQTSAVSVIPGISVQEADRHCFIQLVDAVNQKSHYFKYDFDEFWASDTDFDVKIGRSSFNLKQMSLDIDQDATVIKGTLAFENIIPWPVTLFSPGVMGWYSFVPLLECYHGVLSFNHRLTGQLNIDGRELDFGGGKGYCEKDWGISMPESWIWMQTNHFEETDASFFGSIATIPWRGRMFIGALHGFYYRGQVHRFATYTGARVSGLNIDGDTVTYSVYDKRMRIEVKGTRASGVTLMAPSFGEMSTKIQETLASEVEIRFLKDGKLVFEGTGKNAGLEFVGNIEKLSRGLTRKGDKENYPLDNNK